MNFGTFQGPGLGPQPSSGFKRQIAIVNSTTWIAPVTAYYMIHCCGGGGSGGFGNSLLGSIMHS